MPDQRLPWLTLRFYPDGNVETESGPSRFPVDPEEVKLCAGSVLLMLWQIGQMGYERMLALRQQQYNLDEILRNMPTEGKPS